MERNAQFTPEMGRKTNRRWGIIPVRLFRDRSSGLAGPRVKAWHELKGAFRKVIAALASFSGPVVLILQGHRLGSGACD